jgi:hypothetical protein
MFWNSQTSKISQSLKMEESKKNVLETARRKLNNGAITQVTKAFYRKRGRFTRFMSGSRPKGHL